MANIYRVIQAEHEHPMPVSVEVRGSWCSVRLGVGDRGVTLGLRPAEELYGALGEALAAARENKSEAMERVIMQVRVALMEAPASEAVAKAVTLVNEALRGRR